MEREDPVSKTIMTDRVRRAGKSAQALMDTVQREARYYVVDVKVIFEENKKGLHVGLRCPKANMTSKLTRECCVEWPKVNI